MSCLCESGGIDGSRIDIEVSTTGTSHSSKPVVGSVFLPNERLSNADVGAVGSISF